MEGVADERNQYRKSDPAIYNGRDSHEHLNGRLKDFRSCLRSDLCHKYCSAHRKRCHHKKCKSAGHQRARNVNGTAHLSGASGHRIHRCPFTGKQEFQNGMMIFGKGSGALHNQENTNCKRQRDNKEARGGNNPPPQVFFPETIHFAGSHSLNSALRRFCAILSTRKVCNCFAHNCSSVGVFRMFFTVLRETLPPHRSFWRIRRSPSPRWIRRTHRPSCS